MPVSELVQILICTNKRQRYIPCVIHSRQFQLLKEANLASSTKRSVELSHRRA